MIAVTLKPSVLATRTSPGSAIDSEANSPRLSAGPLSEVSATPTMMPLNGTTDLMR